MMSFAVLMAIKEADCVDQRSTVAKAVEAKRFLM